MKPVVTKLVLILSLFFVISGIGSEVKAQQCAPSIVLDRYECIRVYPADITQPDYCEWRVVGQETLSCNSSTCLTDSICSSDDAQTATCELKQLFGGADPLACAINGTYAPDYVCSPSSCVGGGGNPTPPPSGDKWCGEPCTSASECNSALTCSATNSVCWGSVCDTGSNPTPTPPSNSVGPATAVLDISCTPGHLAPDANISLDLKFDNIVFPGGTFGDDPTDRMKFFLSVFSSTPEGEDIIDYLGDTTWPVDGTWHGYWLRQATTLTTTNPNTLTLTIDDSSIIGGAKGNERTIGELADYIADNHPGYQVTIHGDIEYKGQFTQYGRKVSLETGACIPTFFSQMSCSPSQSYGDVSYDVLVSNMDSFNPFDGNTGDVVKVYISLFSNDPIDTELANILGSPTWTSGNWSGYWIQGLGYNEVTDTVYTTLDPSETVAGGNGKTIQDIIDFSLNYPNHTFQINADVHIDAVVGYSSFETSFHPAACNEGAGWGLDSISVCAQPSDIDVQGISRVSKYQIPEYALSVNNSSHSVRSVGEPTLWELIKTYFGF